MYIQVHLNTTTKTSHIEVLFVLYVSRDSYLVSVLKLKVLNRKLHAKILALLCMMYKVFVMFLKHV
jgi:predicted acyltransferase